MNRANWLHCAEIIDSLRLVPRALIFILLLWTIIVTDRTLVWYMHLPAAERTLEASGLAGVIVTGVTGLFTVVFKIYSATGRDWNAQPIATTTLTASTTTTPAAGQ